MTSTTTTTPRSTSFAAPLAAIGIAVAAVLTAIGTYGDGEGDQSTTDWLVSVGISVIVAAIAYGLGVRGAADGNAGRRALILGGLAIASVVVFWTGAPAVLASGAVACALVEKERRNSFSTPTNVALVMALLATAAAVALAFLG